MSNYIAIALVILITVLIGVSVFMGEGDSTIQGTITNLMEKTVEQVDSLVDGD